MRCFQERNCAAEMGCALAVVAGSPAAGCDGGVPSASAPIARTCESLCGEEVVTTGIRRETAYGTDRIGRDRSNQTGTRSVEFFSPDSVILSKEMVTGNTATGLLWHVYGFT